VRPQCRPPVFPFPASRGPPVAGWTRPPSMCGPRPQPAGFCSRFAAFTGNSGVTRRRVPQAARFRHQAFRRPARVSLRRGAASRHRWGPQVRPAPPPWLSVVAAFGPYGFAKPGSRPCPHFPPAPPSPRPGPRIRHGHDQRQSGPPLRRGCPNAPAAKSAAPPAEPGSLPPGPSIAPRRHVLTNRRAEVFFRPNHNCTPRAPPLP